MSVRAVRPYKVFMLLEEPIANRTAHVTIPGRRAGGSLTLLETFCVVAASRAVKARRVFEFGTFLGSTTLNLALNLPEDGRVFTFDLDEQSAAGLTQHAEDAPLTERHLKTAADFAETPEARKITPVNGNSLTFDFSPWAGAIDLVFIDGGHDLETVMADTRNALRMARSDGPSCILWHDYRNADYPELTGYLDALSAEREILHIEDTMLCASFSGLPGKAPLG
jgi:hypothetical protein